MGETDEPDKVEEIENNCPSIVVVEESPKTAKIPKEYLSASPFSVFAAVIGKIKF